MHSWNDDWPYWNELHEAEDWIGEYVYRWSLCSLQSKEKWGMLRYEWVWPPGTHKSWNYFKLPYIKKHIPLPDGNCLEGHYCPFMWNSSWLYYKWMRYGTWILKRAVKKAKLKFPNVVKELGAGI
jgi:hypothetical protein